jgi:hypothetical protein
MIVRTNSTEALQKPAFPATADLAAVHSCEHIVAPVQHGLSGVDGLQDEEGLCSVGLQLLNVFCELGHVLELRGPRNRGGEIELTLARLRLAQDLSVNIDRADVVVNGGEVLGACGTARQAALLLMRARRHFLHPRGGRLEDHGRGRPGQHEHVPEDDA